MPDTNSRWLTLMYEVQRFIRKRLEDKQLLHEFSGRLSDHQLRDRSQLLELAEPEIRSALQMMVPGLIVDFFMENPELFNESLFDAWVKQKDQQPLTSRRLRCLKTVRPKISNRGKTRDGFQRNADALRLFISFASVD